MMNIRDYAPPRPQDRQSFHKYKKLYILKWICVIVTSLLVSSAAVVVIVHIVLADKADVLSIINQVTTNISSRLSDVQEKFDNLEEIVSRVEDDVRARSDLKLCSHGNGCRLTSSYKACFHFNWRTIRPYIWIGEIQFDWLQGLLDGQFPPLWKRPVDLIFFLYFFVAMQIAMMRALAIHGANVSFIKQYVKLVEPYLGDPSGAPKFQMLTYDYLYVCYYIFAMYGVWSPGQHWMGDFSLVHAGAAGQAQFTYLAGALNSRTSKSLRPPSGGKGAIIFWAVNGILFVMPHLFAFFTQRDTEKFGRTQTIDFASPVRKYEHKFKETRSGRKLK
ncbi:uncharacterized protein LOC101860038 isoform X1 [Aplysia californica]|uniref:Uncharacterized protein LOC101860038 isoform X1 n=1 Tax=Aplysia californica TaxID=6500 RepID=A0ABM1VY56_APLCA|nr:uncharacterized protein LOC101860038 isoform X1 [Aplysia californica]